MSFNLYFAGWGSKDADEYLRFHKANRLLSWVNEGRVINWWKEANLSDRLFIDSGAFSVAHSNKEVDIDDYINYINNNPDIKVWAELDVIPYPVLNSITAKHSSVRSWENYLYMLDNINLDANILPLYHFGEPKQGLLRILDSGAKYIGIGGRHGVSVEEQVSYFNEIFTIIKASRNKDVKVHAFGITVPRILEQFPFYSADSTTWLQSAINGNVLTENLQNICISDGTISDKTNIQTMPKEALDFIMPIFEKYGYAYKELCSDYKVRLRYNIDILLNWEKNYTYKGPKVFKSKRLF